MYIIRPIHSVGKTVPNLFISHHKLLEPPVHKSQEEWNRVGTIQAFYSSFSLVLFSSPFQAPLLLLKLTRTTQWVIHWVGMTPLRSPMLITRNGLLARTSAWEISSVSTQSHCFYNSQLHVKQCLLFLSFLSLEPIKACGYSYSYVI